MGQAQRQWRVEPAAAPMSARIAVGVATRGRPDFLSLVVERLRRQTPRPATILIAYVDPSDIGALPPARDLVLIAASAGLTRQRNAILAALPADAEFVAFFDDDFLPHPHWLRAATAAFDNDPDVACVTGHVIANGVCDGEIAPGEALALVRAATPQAWVEPDVSPYGCNMAFRRSAIGALQFDERLVLYGWLEDRDFAARVGGRQVRLGAALGVHLGVGAGRMSERGLGYAQIANPLHLRRGKTMSRRDFARRVAADFGSNLAKAPRLAARRRRLAGNLLALAEALLGRCRPERAGRL